MSTTTTTETTLLKQKLELSWKLQVVEKQLKEIQLKKVSDEPKKLSERQLQFRRDDALPLCRKYFNKDYVAHKSQILDEINKKFDSVKTRKEKTDKIYNIFVSFFEKLDDEKKIKEKFYVNTDELF